MLQSPVLSKRVLGKRGRVHAGTSKSVKYTKGKKPRTPRPQFGALNPCWKAARSPDLGFLSSLQSRSGFSASLCRRFQRASAGRDRALDVFGWLSLRCHRGHHHTGAHAAHLSIFLVACFLSLHQHILPWMGAEQHVKASALHC